MQTPVILATRCAPLKAFGELARSARFIHGPRKGLMPREEVLRRIGEADVLINYAEIRADEEFLAAAARLKLIVNMSAGFDNLDLDLLDRRGVWAANCPEAFAEPTAEWTFGLLLNVARNGILADAHVREGRWKDDLGCEGWQRTGLAGKTLGIVGFGRIGRAVRKRAEAFGMRVLVHRRTEIDDPAWRPLDVLLAESDVVSLHVPLTKETHHLIDRDRLFRMKPGAILINVGRGKTVDEAALAEALHSGHLSGAGLDVFEDEPRIHPDLLTAPRTVLSPHFAAATAEAITAAWRMAAECIVKVLHGERPPGALSRPCSPEGRQ